MDRYALEERPIPASTGPVAPITRYSFNSVPRNELDDYIRTAAEETDIPHLAHTIVAQAPAHYQHARRDFDNVLVTDTEFDNYLCIRTPEFTKDGSVPQLLITLPTPGVQFESGSRQVVATGRSLVSYLSTTPWDLRGFDATRCRTLTVHLHELDLPDRVVRDMIGRDLGSSPMGALIARHITELADLPELPAAAADALARPTIDLMRSFILLAAGDEDGARGSLSRTLGLRILSYLRAHLHEPTLSVDSVATHFRVSKRYVYVVLAQLDITMGEWVRQHRLRAAAEALRDPALAYLPIVAISRRVGYRDHSSFSRSFKEMYGHTPSEWRAGVSEDHVN